jgi:putative SOS response-associated peptidase YedK
MCGRYSLKADQRRVAEHFQLAQTPNVLPRYNIAPTQQVAVVRVGEAGERRLDMLRWGLIPYWAKDSSIGNRMINARVESVRQKSAFRALISGVQGRARRCLVPADGFFEWAKAPKGKQPYYFHLRSQDVFGMAGLWDQWVDEEGRAVESFTVLTTDANEAVSKCHDRMPVIVRPADYGLWLDPAANGEEAMKAVETPTEAEAMESWAVSTMVNRPEQDVPECVVRLA